MRRHYLLAAFLLLTYTSCLSIQDLSLFDPNLTPEGVRAALDAGADLEARDEYGWTPLLLAARFNENPEMVQALLDAGADLEARNEYGWTPLMYAAEYNSNPEVLQVLLDAGADATAKNGEKETAWDLIQDNEALKDSKAYWRLNDLRYRNARD